MQRAPQNFTSWEAINRTLADAFPADRYHGGATLTDFGNGEGAVQAHAASTRSRNPGRRSRARRGTIGRRKR